MNIEKGTVETHGKCNFCYDVKYKVVYQVEGTYVNVRYCAKCLKALTNAFRFNKMGNLR